MNLCRICKRMIPERFNWWPALRCASCRSKQDEKLAEMLEEWNLLESENEYLRSRFFDTENEYTKLNYNFKRMKKRYDLLRQRHSVVLQNNRELEAKNEKLRRWAERLFTRNNLLQQSLDEKNENCYWLAKENAELKKKLEETETILESKREEVKKLLERLHQNKKE